MALNIIDFSNGIRPEEIQENFEYLQEQLSRERASVGGVGIASGLEIKVVTNNSTFGIEISDGSIIDNNGDEIPYQENELNSLARNFFMIKLKNIDKYYFNCLDEENADFIFKSHHAGLTKEELTVPLIIINK